MDAFGSTLEVMVNSFTDATELMNFVATMGIQESPVVRYRLYELQHMVNHEYEEDLELALDYVRTQEEVEESIKAILFDEEMEKLTMACVNDGEWPENRSQSPIADEEMIDDPQPGPSGLQYQIRKKDERTYAKNGAVDRTYEIKINENHHGEKLSEIQNGLHAMFDDVLSQARGDLAGNDLGRVVIFHEGLHDPIIVPLQAWDQLDVQRVMEYIEKVLNSNEGLSIDHSFLILVGSIDLPKGGARRRITNIKGEKNSLQLKKSIVTIENDDQMCMARAIGVSWAKLHRCSPDEWKEITKHRKGKSNLDLILEHQKVPQNYYKNLCRNNLKQQKQLAVRLCESAGVSMDRLASLNDAEAFEKLLNVRVMVVSARLGNKFITSPSSDDRPCIYIYLVDDEHFHAITNITGFFSARYFCDKCLKHYDHRERHECEIKCLVCKRNLCFHDEPKVCTYCNMTCRSQECYEEHKKVPLYQKGKKKGQPSGPSECDKWWKCPTCYKVIRQDKRKKEEHRCGEYMCSSCDRYVMDDHQCYLRATPAKEHYIPKFIFFYFECSQDDIDFCNDGYVPFRKENCRDCQLPDMCKSCSKCQNCKTSWCGKATHRPNFVVAHSICPKCIDQELTPDSICKGCGTRCEECDNTDLHDNEDEGPCPGRCGFREVTFRGVDTAEKFGQWLFTDQHKYFKVVAHNMKGYDGYFLLEYLIDQSLRPDKIIYNGSKIMYMTVEKDLHIKVIDSLNFLPMKLSALPQAFGLEELKKGWFPHFFNTKENQNYIGKYPDANCYGVDFMSEKERKGLVAWLNEKKDDVFDFRKEMLEYCRSDVDISRKSCMKFRHLLMNATGEEREIVNKKGKIEKRWFGAVDPFDSVTIASVCMNVFRTKFLEENWKVKMVGHNEWLSARMINEELYVQKGIEWIHESKLLGEKVSEREFVSTAIAKIPPGGYNDQFSKSSIQWLEWMAHVDKVHIQHGLNEFEKTIPGTRYKLDGYCRETNTAYEYHGCIFHGCHVCFSDKREETYHPLTRQSLDESYALTMKKKSHLESLGMKYVCIWDHDFKKQINENSELKQFISQLDLSDRLDARESFFGGRTNASQLYYKVNGNEKIKYVDFTSLYPWVNKYCRYPVGHPTIITKDFGDMENYFGIAKVKILPPRGLYHPVLPYRSNGKLKFSLCRTCADTESQEECTCTNEQRELIGTWCTSEIETALRLGYKITKIYEVYHWEESTQYDPNTHEGGLFAKYIDTFLKFKQEASGPPEWVKNENDMIHYIKQYFEKEGVSLDRERIVKNPGLRALAKLCLNSFWGKFCQRLNMRQTEFFHECQANLFFQLLSDPLKHPIDFHISSNDVIQVEWQYKNDCQPEDNKTNIYLATFTTCWARLKLYSVLEKLDKRVLYYDTDSIIYVSSPNTYDPPLGDYLGELTNELQDDEYIVEFVSGGPKNYAYKTNKNHETSTITDACLPEETYESDCIQPFSTWEREGGLYANLCREEERAVNGSYVFYCIIVQTSPQNNCSYRNQVEESKFAAIFSGVNYDLDIICETYLNPNCTSVLGCFSQSYNFDNLQNRVAGFYNFFCGSDYLQAGFRCLKPTVCPKTTERAQQSISFLLKSTRQVLNLGDLQEPVTNSCQTLTEADTTCILGNANNLNNCGVAPYISTDITNAQLVCNVTDKSETCVTQLCSSNVASFYINMFGLFQCTLRVACSTLMEDGIVWLQSLAGESQYLACGGQFVDGQISRQCLQDGTWGPVVKNCKLSNSAVEDLLDQVNGNLSANGTNNTTQASEETLTNIQDSIGDLNNNLGNDAVTLTTDNIENIVQLMDNVFDLIQGSVGNNVSSNATQQLLDTTITTIDNVLDPENTEIWQEISTDQTTVVKPSWVLDITEKYVEVAQTQYCDTSASTQFEKPEQFVFVSVGQEASDILFPSPLSQQTVTEIDITAANITIPAETLRNKGLDTTVCVGGTYLTTLGSYLEPTKEDNGQVVSFESKQEVNSDIVSVQINSDSNLDVTNLDPPVMIHIKPKNPGYVDPQCVYWDFGIQGTVEGQRGAWSTRGCNLVSYTNDVVICSCDHLTNFAVLMSPNSVQEAQALNIISAIGCGISILCLLLTIISHMVVWRLVRSDRATILMNLCVALLLAMIVFIAGINRVESRAACAAIAAVIQFLFLAVFFLMFLMGIEILICVVHVFGTKFRIKLLLPLMWICAGVIVGISVGVTKAKGYGNEKFCWLDTGTGLIWAFIGPAVFVIVVNFIVMGVVFKKMSTSAVLKSKSAKIKALTTARSLCVLLPLLGVTWVFGLLAVNEDTAFFAYIFCILNSLQGLFIFLFHCIFNRQIQDAWKQRQARKRSLQSFSSEARNKSKSAIHSSTQYDSSDQKTKQSASNSAGHTNTPSSGKQNGGLIMEDDWMKHERKQYHKNIRQGNIYQ